MTMTGYREGEGPGQGEDDDGETDEDSAEDDLPTYDVDLDLPPSQRWRAVARAFRAPFQALLQRNDDVLGPLRALPSCVGRLVLRTLPGSQREDVEALAALLGCGRPLLAVLQVVYELFSLTDLLGGSCGCTAAVKQYEDGVLHGRTLDWSWLEGLEELLVTLRVHRSRRPLYVCTSFVGHVGVLTGMRLPSGNLRFLGRVDRQVRAPPPCLPLRVKRATHAPSHSAVF